VNALKQYWRSCLLFLSVSLLAVPVAAQRGAITLPQNLVQLTDKAETIVHGRIVRARVEPHPQYKNLNSVVVTVAVKESLKGAPGKTISFRQFIWDPRDKFDLAGYRRGDEVILFLNKITEIGFTSPVGLQQGRFLVQTDKTGQRVAVNGQDNARLLEGISDQRATAHLSKRAKLALAQRSQFPGPLPVDVLEETVRALVSDGGAQ